MLSWDNFCLSCLFSMVADISGLSKSRCDLRRLPINNSAGAIPVDEWGVILYLNKNFANFSFIDPPDICL